MAHSTYTDAAWDQVCNHSSEVGLCMPRGTIPKNRIHFSYICHTHLQRYKVWTFLHLLDWPLGTVLRCTVLLTKSPCVQLSSVQPSCVDAPTSH